VRFLEENADRISYYVMGLLMVLPGSRLYDDPKKYGISSVTFEQNPLMTPEPVWRSEIRMPARAVQNIYNRLSGLEGLYAINDYPYVGGLSTNHGFLYFSKYGPGILKRLRKEESERYRELKALLLSGGGLSSPKRLKSVVPFLNLPWIVYSSPFAMERIEMDQDVPPAHATLLARSHKDYLVDPVNLPFRIDSSQKKVLQRIDGERNLKAILDKLKHSNPEELLRFLLHTTAHDLTDLTSVDSR